MLKKIIMGIVVILPLVAFAAKPIVTQDPIITAQPIPTTPQELIVYYAKKYNTDPNVLLSVAKCESGYNQSVIGDKGLAVGIFQYHNETWNRMSKLYGETLDKNSIKDQARLTAFIYANYPEMRTEWTTFRAIQKGGTYSFYSTLLKNHYTVKCSLL